jgi:hypothetical protein
MAARLPTGVVADLVLSFLDLAGELHEAAVAIYDDHPYLDSDISRLYSALATTVDLLRGETSRGDDAHIPLVDTCVKLGQDLLVRLDRLQALQDSHGLSADLRKAWPAAAVDALGDRIQMLHDQWSIST